MSEPSVEAIDNITYLKLIRDLKGFKSWKRFAQSMDYSENLLFRVLNGTRPMSKNLLAQLIELDTDEQRREAKRVEMNLMRVTRANRVAPPRYGIHHHLYLRHLIRTMGYPALCEAAEITPNYLSNIVGGKYPFTASLLARLEKVSNLSFNDYLEQVLPDNFQNLIDQFEGKLELLHILVDYFTYEDKFQ